MAWIKGQETAWVEATTCNQDAPQETPRIKRPLASRRTRGTRELRKQLLNVDARSSTFLEPQAPHLHLPIRGLKEQAPLQSAEAIEGKELFDARVRLLVHLAAKQQRQDFGPIASHLTVTTFQHLLTVRQGISGQCECGVTRRQDGGVRVSTRLPGANLDKQAGLLNSKRNHIKSPTKK